jgi:hypothetical protein
LPLVHEARWTQVEAVLGRRHAAWSKTSSAPSRLSGMP